MNKVLQLEMVVVLLTALGYAGGPCPIMVVSGTGDDDGIRVTIRNQGKLPIRGLDFSCTARNRRTGKLQAGSCREDNTLVYPGTEYTASFLYPDGKAQTVRMSVRSVTLADGYMWRPSKGQACRVIDVRRARKTQKK